MNKGFYLLLTAAMTLSALSLQAGKVIKVLAIGNSFSRDAVEQNLYELAHAQGDSLVIGNAYIGGCSIDRHWNNVLTGKRDYQYRKIVGGTLTNRKHMNIEDIVVDEPWDIITVQQCSPTSGLDTSYTHLYDLVNYVRNMATNTRAKIGFHKTWAYAQSSTHKAFPNYHCNQFEMFRSIQQAVHKEVDPNVFAMVIPCAEAIQMGRAELGDTLCKDGYHLSVACGRYIAACTWCEVLTGKDVTLNSWHPAFLNPQSAAVARRAAHQAVAQEQSDKIQPCCWADGLFFERMPRHASRAKKKKLKCNGRKIVALTYRTPLPDSLKCLALPDYKVGDGAAWQEVIQKKLKLKNQ